MGSIYSEKLKDPRWQKKRLEIFERDGWKCQWCDDDKNTLAIHHKKYLPRIEPWDYPNDLLITLCEACHNEEYETRAEVESQLIEALKSLSAPAIGQIALSFEGSTFVGNPYGFALVLDWILTHPGIFDEMGDRYWEEVRNLKSKEVVNG